MASPASSVPAGDASSDRRGGRRARRRARAGRPTTACGSRPAPFGPWETNAYLVWDGRSPDALVLDPGMGAAAAAHGARRRERPAPPPDRELARAHRPHLRRRPADRGVGRAAGDPPGRCLSARRPQQLRLRDEAGDSDARPASRASRSASATSSSTCCTRRATRRDRSASTRSAIGTAPGRRRPLRRHLRSDRSPRRQRRADGRLAARLARERCRPTSACFRDTAPETTIGRELPWLRPDRRGRQAPRSGLSSPASGSASRRSLGMSGSGPRLRCEW